MATNSGVAALAARRLHIDGGRLYRVVTAEEGIAVSVLLKCSGCNIIAHDSTLDMRGRVIGAS